MKMVHIDTVIRYMVKFTTAILFSIISIIRHVFCLSATKLQIQMNATFNLLRKVSEVIGMDYTKLSSQSLTQHIVWCVRRFR